MNKDVLLITMHAVKQLPRIYHYHHSNLSQASSSYPVSIICLKHRISYLTEVQQKMVITAHHDTVTMTAIEQIGTNIKYSINNYNVCSIMKAL